ncbi:PTS system mannose/fructose/sorbose family transporter subunit IID [Lactobacillus sp. ESL0791]|nr:PTS system mannose/fructose/sorbose family transporter subunit IID [Lactobacillus sp. ESL0791]MDF7637853.1 PTS system mannose/fructose/sorbose family transporter subunit IID [Lactobacillus sp. ESL0791]
MTEKDISKTDYKLLKSLFWRSFTVFANFNYAIHGGCGFCYSLLPFINHYYKDQPEKKKEALKRNIVFYNATQNVGTFIMSLVASMEKQASRNSDFDVESINATKASLMGPFSGVGDTLFWGILRVVSAGIAMALGAQGNFLAPIIFLIVYNIPSIWCRWELTKLGFSVGSKYVMEMFESGMMGVLTKAASTLGLIMLGGMTSNLVKINTKLVFNLGGGQVLKLQEILDQIFKGILPLVLTLGCFYLLSKKKVNFTLLIVLIIILSILLAFLGFV